MSGILAPVFVAPAGADAAREREMARYGGFASAYTLLWEPQAELDRDLDMMRAAGGTWLRFDMPWSVVEQQPGVYWWDPIDRLVNAASARQFGLLATLAYTPAWARPAGTDDKWAPSTAAHRSAFGRFAAAAAARYGSKIGAWEIWNEQNATPFWKPAPDPAGYAALLHEASVGLRSVEPGARIVLGGLAAVGNEFGNVDPEVYLRRVYDLGAGNDVTAVGVHVTSYPYSPDDPATAEWNVLLRLPEFRDFLVSRGFTRTRLWVTEYGAPTQGARAVTEQQQAAHVVASYTTLREFGAWVGPLFWYTPRDKGNSSTDVDQNYGLVRRDFSPKPAYDAYRTLMSG